MKSLIIMHLFALTIFTVLSGCVAGLSSTESTASDASKSSESTQMAPQKPNSASETSAAGNTAPTTTEAITEEQAKAAALAHAGLTEAKVTFVSVRLDYDEGQQVYEVEFYKENTEYDYEIDAMTGEIRAYDTDIEDYAIGQDHRFRINIDETTAKAIVLEKVPGATDANIRIYLDYDDGRPMYEGAIVHNETKYEFDINAADGSIIEWEMESIYD